MEKAKSQVIVPEGIFTFEEFEKLNPHLVSLTLRHFMSRDRADGGAQIVEVTPGAYRMT